jgi:hypothetical protein
LKKSKKYTVIADPDAVILIDESGTPGYNANEKNQMFIMVASVILSNNKTLIDIANSVKPDTRSTSGIEPSGELKYFTSKDEIRTKVMKQMSALNIFIYSTSVDKSKGKWSAENTYHSSVREIIRIAATDPRLKHCRTIDVIFDRCSYLSDEDAIKITKESWNSELDYPRSISCKPSEDDKRLQCHDFITGTVGRFLKSKERFEDYELLSGRTMNQKVVPPCKPKTKRRTSGK